MNSTLKLAALFALVAGATLANAAHSAVPVDTMALAHGSTTAPHSSINPQPLPPRS